MRKITLLIATAGAAIAGSAAAQVSVGAEAQVDPGQVVGDTTATVDDTVEDTMQTTQDTVDATTRATQMQAATSAQVQAGVAVKDSAGEPVGTVVSVDGDIVTVTDGDTTYNIPMAGLFANSADVVTELYVGATKAELEPVDAAADADVSADAEAGDDGM